MKTIKYFIQAIFVYLFFILISIFRIKLSRNIFSLLFNFLGPLIKSNKIINKNLDIAKITDKIKRKNIIKNIWSNYGKVFVEYIFLKSFIKDKKINLNQNTIKILEAIKIKKKPVIFISGHFANFELMSLELNRQNFKLATIYRPLNNFFLNPFMEYLRRKYICKNQIKKGMSGLRHAVSFLQNKTSIALMVDQRVSEGNRIPFFNEKALTTTLPAQLALRYKIDIVPVYIFRDIDDSFSMELFEPIKTENLINSEENKIQLTIDLNKFIEKMILKDPSQWIWTHNRWK